MKGIFWNSNGFRDPKKHKFVSDLTKESNLNFIVYQRPVGVISHLDFSRTFVREEIIFVLVNLRMVHLGACCLG
jgi:hypothetical protein